MSRIFLAAVVISVVLCSFVDAQNEVTEFENPTDCGNQQTDWKPCIERKIADQVFASCCERFVPPECRGLCIYESNAIEARIVLMHTIQPSRCRLYKYLSSIVHCAAQTHDNTECCEDMGVHELGPQCLQMCQPQANPRQNWGIKSLRKDYVICLAKWDQIMQCHHSGLRARKIPKKVVNRN
uniref:DB domain-containing protein n=1 Tax=Syphacia muris TaxID=451379 RepID=A0A0N5ALD1_9BILA